MATLTGNGTSITFATSGSVGRIISIDEWTESVTMIEDNDLSMVAGDHDKYCAGATIQHGPWPFSIAVDPSVQNPMPLGGAAQLITITRSDGSTVFGNGWVTQRSEGSYESNARVEGGFELHFEGGSGGIGRTAPT